MKRNIIIIAVTAVLLALVGTTSAVAGSLITSRQIQDGTIRLADLRPGAVDRLSGSDGTDGVDGVDAQALPYGVAQVKVQRGAGTANPWATYSTTIGNPVGDTTGGTFRFTCSEAQAPCKVSAAGYATEDGATVYPRVSIQTQSLNGGPQTYCEYGDGPLSGVLSTDAAAATALPIHIGGSDDCGLNGAAGAVNEITVPAGYYDVTSTFQFVG
jgi:hypothetical protein